MIQDIFRARLPIRLLYKLVVSITMYMGDLILEECFESEDTQVKSQDSNLFQKKKHGL